ncbi:hypothetical protein [Pseudobutyrivibrio xylanivorans]|uniref:Uncharacterized protein n=1 Tax=Pseudobutyrivibrio xylanivorans TaxID=185007 RepID=A0A1G5RX77_PSEXY|nr:hypothetical protein [Pseudobutyrivibrio xylanivorans]SCZ78643.1 hypothetical protein SAMN02910350_01375 [Pseudobutyrivibrio xylanivorans]
MTSKIVSNNKLICYSNKYFIFSKGPKIFISSDINCREYKTVNIPVGSLKQMLGSARLFARALRLEPRCGIFVDDTTALITYHGAIYRVDCTNGQIELEHNFRAEMNNPLNLVKIQGISGFEDGIYYGEYFLNHEGTAVNIYKRDNNASWNVIYTFPAGSIYHIHGLVPCKEKDCVYILTGDKDAESGIYEARNGFQDVKVIVSGKQAYRACVALPTENGLLYTTDTPLETNYLYYLDFETKELKVISEINGPCIYGRLVSNNEMVFSTSVEPDSRLPRWKYELSKKVGPGVKDNYSHVYIASYENGNIDIEEVFKAKKDILPMGIGQFGAIMFPAGEGDLYITGQALRKYDNKTVVLKGKC